MKWEDGRRSSNVEDRRGQAVSGGGRRGLKLGGGVGTIVIALVAIYFGLDPSVVLNSVPDTTQPTATKRVKPTSAEEDKLADFVSVVLADTEDTWHVLFRQANKTYREPKLVLFTDLVKSACGLQRATVGPFYCPADTKVYIDLGFFHDLAVQYKAPGDFAQAYVVAHEVGHHVQNLLGTSNRVVEQKRRLPKIEANKLSIAMELQADCYAGIWAHHADNSRHVLEAGDIAEGLAAAGAVGDDRLQMLSRGYVTHETFTHGTSKQRMEWFQRGLKSGTLEACDTFGPNTP